MSRETECCPCCGKPLYVFMGRRTRHVGNYCDLICYAAAHTLTPTALHFWNRMAAISIQ